MVHEMNLDEGPFRLIAEGRKTVEMRLYDEKRRTIQVGDRILFTKRNGNEKITARVKALHRFPTFEKLYQTLPMTACGYTEQDSPSYTDMYTYYSKEKIETYGVLGIELECVVPFVRELEE